MKKIVTMFLVLAMMLQPIISSAKTESHMIDVGGYNLYVEDIKENNPSKHDHKHDERYCGKKVTVVLEAGYGESHETFEDLIYELEPYAHIITYDRANLGQSDQTTTRRTVENQVDELTTILEELNVQEFIYVAHSMGSYNARVLADKMKDRIKAIILIDGSHEDQNEALLELLPDEVKDLYKNQFNIEGDYEDVQYNASVVRGYPDAYRNMPLTVIYATDHGLTEEVEIMWFEFQHKVADMSDFSRIVVHEGGHFIHQEDPLLIRDAVLFYINSLY